MAHELRRLGARCVSLAPRYISTVEKGVYYIGDVSSFEADLSIHAAIARTATLEGTYKLSLHSGSDKVSIYLAFVRQTLAHS
jgi:tagaturonate epimerase